MHYMDANKTAGEEARRQLYKIAASNLEQVLAQNPTRHQHYGHLLPITKTIKDEPDMQDTAGEAGTSS